MMRTPMNKFALLLALGFALGASGCIRLLPKPPPPPMIYSLDAAPAGAPPAFAPKNTVISVGVPDAPRSLSTADLAWRTNGVLAYVEQASWQGRNLDLLQTLLVHTFDRSGKVRGAVRTGEGGSNAEIHWDLIAFEVVEGAGLEARIQTNVKLFESRTRRLIAQREFAESVPMSDRAASAAARALEQAARNMAAKIVDWATAEAPEQDRIAPPAPALPPGSVTPAPR
jgi:cholesterol transport system auxiliary component